MAEANPLSSARMWKLLAVLNYYLNILYPNTSKASAGGHTGHTGTGNPGLHRGLGSLLAPRLCDVRLKPIPIDASGGSCPCPDLVGFAPLPLPLDSRQFPVSLLQATVAASVNSQSER